MDTLGVVALGSVAFFVLLTIPFQYRPFAERLSRYDYLHLLPRWTFFAPNPATRDGHILVRYRLRDGSESEWACLDMSTPRRAIDPIWNPGKRSRKVVSDCINAIKSVRAETKNDAVIKYYIPYLIVLNVALHAASLPPDCTDIQFSIVETSGRSNRRIWITFVSEFHPVTPMPCQ